ncbi:MAG: hypothetical protein MJ252_28410 [archaeon]|nr:hypothetical protein [archaeon]
MSNTSDGVDWYDYDEEPNDDETGGADFQIQIKETTHTKKAEGLGDILKDAEEDQKRSKK